MGGEIRCRLEGMMTDYDFIADHWPDISAVVLLPNNLKRSKSHPPWIQTCAKNSEALAVLLRVLDTFNTTETLMFSNLDTRLEPAILDVVTSRGIPFHRVGPFLFMKITSKQSKFSPAPKGFFLDCLQPEQSEMVIKNWPYTIGEDTELYFREMIASMPSVALYNEEKILVGYAMMYHYGMPGMLHVMEEYRGQGYAKVIMYRLTALCLEKNKEMFIAIGASNEPSIQLHKRIGFEVVPEVRHGWIVCNEK